MQTIYLDISNKGVVPCIQAKQSEVGRKFLAVITDNGVPYNISNDSLLSVWYEGDTDAGNYSSIEEKSAFSIDGNKVSVELVAQMLLKPGKGELCLSITHGDGGETNTWNIPYEVEYKPGAGSAIPTEYYTALTDAASNAAEQVGLAKNQADIAKEQADIAKEQATAATNTTQFITPNAVSDMNTMTNLFGYVNGASTANHALPNNTGFAINRIAGAYQMQYIFYLSSPGKIASRTKTSGVWSDWSTTTFSYTL